VRPEAIIDGVVAALGILEKKRAALKNQPAQSAA
jgi:Ni,Fe-hydrogenase III small subunit